MLRRAVVEAVRQHLARGEQRERDQTGNDSEMEQAGLGHRITSLRGLEADVLESFGGVPVQASCQGIVAAATREVALGHPRGGAVAG
jgi:hypothetical protein